MTETMVERVAKAMRAAGQEWQAGFARNHPSAAAIVGPTATPVEVYARAAIEAMRVPTPAMQRVVSAQWGHRTWSQYDEVIDAALQETTDERG